MAKAKQTKSSKGREGLSNRIIDDALALAGTLLRSRKEFGAEKLRSLAEATRDYATSMTDLPNLRVHVASASESIDGLADYVMHTDIEHMVTDAGTFARRYPFATLGVTVAAGVVATRLLRPTVVVVKPRTRAARKPIKQTSRTRRGTNGHAQPHA
jgi:ElaB/YqjD/DUF883 family membrane-anchored ribosome-binding protein